jgi:hypothetical protein
MVFASAFYVDLGHLRPLHPLTLQWLAERSSFSEIKIIYSAIPGPEIRLQPLALTGQGPTDNLVRQVNENFHRIDKLLFGPQDFALVARR